MGQPRTSAEPDPTSARRTLEGYHLSKIQLKRSSDKYPDFVSRGATRFGFARDVCIIKTDQGAWGGAMASPNPKEIAAMTGTRVSDFYDIATGTTEKGMSIDLPLYDLLGNILDLPVYKLLAGNGPTSLTIYGNSIHFEDHEPLGKPEGVPR